MISSGLLFFLPYLDNRGQFYIQPFSISLVGQQRSANQHYTQPAWKNTGAKEQQAPAGVGSSGHISARDNNHTDVFGGRWRSPAESTLLHFTSVTRRMGI